MTLNATTLKLVGAILAALAIAILIHDRNGWKAKATERQEQLSAEQAAHRGTVANYRAAADQARKLDAANAARVKAAQTTINEETIDAYEKRIADARARAERLQREAGSTNANPGSRGAASVPGVSRAAGGADEAARADRLPDPDRLIATEQAIQLDELIKWVRRQALVDVNGNARP